MNVQYFCGSINVLIAVVILIFMFYQTNKYLVYMLGLNWKSKPPDLDIRREQ